MQELLVGIILAAASGAAFMAYNHPKQYMALLKPIVWIYVGVALMSKATTLLDNAAIARIQKLTELHDDQKKLVISIIKMPIQGSPILDILGACFVFAPLYLIALYALPAFGITAEAKKDAR